MEIAKPTMVEQSLAMVTALAPVIGHDRAAKIAKEASTSGKTVREVALAHKILSPEKLARILDPWRMTEPGIPEKE
jgi:fumarate hydratase, class II